MKHYLYSILAGLMLTISSVIACDIDNDEKLVCEVVLCAVGIFVPESHSKCVKVNREFAYYLATLGFWEDPPKCKMRDMSCKSTGNASSQQATLPASTCTGLSGNDYLNCRFHVSKYNGVPFRCDQYRRQSWLYRQCVNNGGRPGRPGRPDGGWEDR